MKINRPFPGKEGLVDPQITQQLLDRVIKPTFPDEELRTYFLHCMARALAGEIYDKRWYLNLGERNSGKGVICILLEAFGPFVKTFDTSNIMCTR